MRCHFIPQYLLDTLAGAPDTEAAARGRRTMDIDAELHAHVVAPAVTTGAAWEIHDAHNGSALPGELVRTAGEPEVGDVTVDEAATGITESLALFADFGRSSYDDRGATVVATVHYEQDYDNAFWDGNQLVFGDGDGQRLRPVHQAHRRAGSRALPRRHAVHGRPHLPGAVGCAERVDLRRLRCVHQAALTSARTPRAPTGSSGRASSCPASTVAPCARCRTRHGVRRPADRQGPPGRVDGRLRRDDRRQRRRTPQQRHPQPGLRARGAGDRRATPGAAPAGSGTPPSPPASRRTATSPPSRQPPSRPPVSTPAPSRTPGTTVGVTPGASSGHLRGDHAVGHRRSVVRRSGGFAGLTKEGAVDLELRRPARAHGALAGRPDRLHRRRNPAGPQPDRFVYRFRYATIECQVQEQALTPDLHQLAAIVLEE